MKKKKCSICKKVKSLIEFKHHPKTKDNLSPICITCEIETEAVLKEYEIEMTNQFNKFSSRMKSIVDSEVIRINEKLKKRDYLIVQYVFEYLSNIRKDIEQRDIFNLPIFNKNKSSQFISIIEHLQGHDEFFYNDLPCLLDLQCKININNGKKFPHLLGLLNLLNSLGIIKKQDEFRNIKEYLEEVSQVFECPDINITQRKYSLYIGKCSVDEAESYYKYLLNDLPDNIF